ncbi:MAG TPA: hypothetical protein VFP56_12505 [Candidatus Limnocylindrales bacterium]|nr:hypothetical protein [Candidatus Limnocylindrales bacterium]
MTLAVGVLMVAACDSLTNWFVPDVTCSGWRNVAEEGRSELADRIIRADHLFEGVQIAQHVPPGTPEDQLVAMASASVTKNCEIQQWNPAIQVRDLLRDLYGRPGQAGGPSAVTVPVAD